MADKRILVSFGRSDPLHLTEATYALLGDGPMYMWGPDFGRPKPEWVVETAMLGTWLGWADVVYTGHGATLLEATAAGCEVMVLCGVEPVRFAPAWTVDIHLDHSGLPVEWRAAGVMAGMAREIAGRRK